MTEMKKCLITGCGGFIGSNLADFLLQKGLNVYGFVNNNTEALEELKGSIHIIQQDILDKRGMQSVIKEVRPDYVFHLAALSNIPLSWAEPEKTINTNVIGTLNLLDAIKTADINPVIEITGSSSEYGNSGTSAPLPEDHHLNPSSPYAVSKIAAGEFARLYWQNYGLHTIRTRPFYIVGGKKNTGACYEFASRIVDIEKGKADTIKVGNLDAIRDVVNVKDAVRAMWTVAEIGTAGELYNICSGQGISMRQILENLSDLSNVSVKIETDPKFLRPLDEPMLIGDCAKLKELGWKPEITLEETLYEILQFARGMN